MDAIGVASDVVMYMIISIAVIQDYRYMRISNRLICIGLATGLAFRITTEGSAAIVHFLVNITFPVIVLYLLFLARAIGAGDIKLFSTIGAFVNFNQLFFCICFAFLIGAVFSLVKLMKNHNLQSSLLHALEYLTALPMGQMRGYEREWAGSKNLIHFSLAIAVGTAIAKGVF